MKLNSERQGMDMAELKRFGLLMLHPELVEMWRIALTGR